MGGYKGLVRKISILAPAGGASGSVAQSVGYESVFQFSPLREGLHFTEPQSVKDALISILAPAGGASSYRPEP